MSEKISDIQVGNIVFHNRKGENAFLGPGVIQKIEYDDLFGVFSYTVFWQSSGQVFEHFRSSLKTIAEAWKDDHPNEVENG